MKPYSKKENVSFAIGVFATLELLKYKPTFIRKIVISPKGNTNKGVQEIKRFCESNNIELEYNDGFIKNLSGKENMYAVGIFHKYETHLSPTKDHVVVVSPSDFGNLGTIIRTAYGFGFENIALIRPAADIFDPKCLRASQGALFGINFEYFNSFDEYTEKFPRKFVALDGSATTHITDLVLKGSTSIVLGTEGAGLSKSVLSRCESVSIPHKDTIDSLNVSVAAGIALYYAYQKRYQI